MDMLETASELSSARNRIKGMTQSKMVIMTKTYSKLEVRKITPGRPGLLAPIIGHRFTCWIQSIS